MNIAQRDIAKVRFFARKMGIKIRILEATKRGDCAYAYFEDKRIVIYKRPGDSDLRTLTTVLHEVSHILNYIINPEDYKKFMKLDDNDKSSKARKIQYELEKRDISKMKEIHSLLGLKSSRRAIIASELLDTHQYEHYLQYGKYPTKIEKRMIKRDVKILSENFL